jgi:hypothetical protein
MSRVSEERGGRGFFRDPPRVHDDHAPGVPGDDAEVVADQQKRETSLLPKAIEQLENLGGDRRVERGRRLVRDENRWVRRQRHGEKGPLPQPPGKAVRILVHSASGIGEPDLAQALPRDPLRLATGDRAVRPHGLDDLRADGGDRIERRAGLLKDERDLPPANAPPLLLARAAKLAAADPDRPSHAGIFRRETEEGAGRQSLAAPALADHRERLSRREVEGDAVDCRGKLPASGNLDDQIADREKRGRRQARRNYVELGT